METDTDTNTIFFMDCVAFMAVYSIGNYLVQKHYLGQFDVYDPYFFLLFVYLDYLGNRYKNNHRGFLKMILN